MNPHDQTCRICGYPQSAHTVHTLYGGAQIIEQSIVGSVIRCWGFVGVEHCEKTLSVDPIHAGDEGEGPLESTDIFITGPDLSVLINVPATGEPVTYHGRNGADEQSGTIPQTPSHNVPAEHAMIGATLDALAAGISVEDLRAVVKESENDPENMVG